MVSERDYPTDAELKKIEKWGFDDMRGWLDFVCSIWWMPDWGIRTTKRRLYISTGGWSGNEQIIGAMNKNFINWSQTWFSSRTGGHFIFKLPRKTKCKAKKS